MASFDIKMAKFKAPPKSLIDAAVNKAVFAAKEQILTDCNYYVKVDQGTLRATSHAEVKDGTISCVWDQKYARRQYYTGTPHTDVNPNASIQWAEKAARSWNAQWREIIQKGMREALR